jgi:hypothetical protein
VNELSRSWGIRAEATRPNESGADLRCVVSVSGLTDLPTEAQLNDLEARTTTIFLAVHGDGFVHSEAQASQMQTLGRADLEDL